MPMTAFLRALAGCLLLGAGAGAADSASAAVRDTSAPVATIDGNPITIRMIEDALLQKEGREQLNDWLSTALANIPWTQMPDDAAVVTIGGSTLTRRTLALQLLEKSAAEAREDLIGLTLVGNALRHEGIVVRMPEVDREWARMERALHAELARKGQPLVPLENYLQVSKGMTKDQFIRNPGFLMGVGITLLVERRARAELIDERLIPWFEARRAAYDEAAGVLLSTVYMPFVDEEGRPVPPTPDSRQGKLELLGSVRAQLVAGALSATQAHQMIGRAYEREAEPDGRIGWVARDGRRDRPGRRMPAAVMEAAFAMPMAGTAAVVLPPIAHEQGVELVTVHARRAARTVAFAEVRERVFQDRLLAETKDRTAALMRELRRSADIAYLSIPDAIGTRRLAGASASATAAAGR